LTRRNLKKGSFKKEENAVSPVIGVILMVAITVILAAVIGAFVFGMGGSVSRTYTVGLTAAQTGADTVDVTFQGGPDADVVEHINVSVNNKMFGRSLVTDTKAVDGVTTVPTFGTVGGARVAVGTTITLDDTVPGTYITAERDHLIATATFLDGSQQVILDTYV